MSALKQWKSSSKNRLSLLTAVAISSISAPVAFAEELNFAPDCSQATATPELIRIPNHQLTPIEIGGVTDPDGDAVSISTQCIVQDEPVGAIRWLFGKYDASGLGTSTPKVRAAQTPVFFDWETLDLVRSEGRVYHIVFKATDARGAMCSGSATAGVPLVFFRAPVDNGGRFESMPDGENCAADPINNPPIIHSIPTTQARVGEAYSYMLQGHDPDTDPLSFSLISAPTGMVVNQQTGLIQWTPGPDHVGDHTIVARVTDTGLLYGEQTFTIAVEQQADQLSASIIANPTQGLSPLTVRFSPSVNVNNLIVTNYSWDFNGDGVFDRSDAFGAPQTYTYTGQPGDAFEATLRVTTTLGEPLIATKTISIANQGPQAQVDASLTNGHAPLAIAFVITASDPQGLSAVQIDYDGDGEFDDSVDAAGTSGSWSFQHTYTATGTYVPVVRVSDQFGATAIVTNNAITVDVNDLLDPVVELAASLQSSNAPLTTTLTASAQLFDGVGVAAWRWDLDGDGVFELVGGTALTDQVTHTYANVDYFYPVVELETETGRTARASIRLESASTATPTLSIPNTSDTINSDLGQEATFSISLPYASPLAIWIENSSGELTKTVQVKAQFPAGIHNFAWDATSEAGGVTSAGDHYVVVGYETYGTQRELDLRTSTGGSLTYYRRAEANPRTFDRLKQPIRINYAVDDPSEITFFWQVSFGARLMTLLEHERMGRGQYSLYWNGDYPSGEKIPNNLDALMPGIVRYTLPNNVIFVKETPRIDNFVLKSTVIGDPRRDPVELQLLLSKASTVEVVVSDMDKGVDVASRVYQNVPAGEQRLVWDAKNNNDQYLAPGDYRVGVRSVDDKGNRSLYWYRTQRIEY